MFDLRYSFLSCSTNWTFFNWTSCFKEPLEAKVFALLYILRESASVKQNPCLLIGSAVN